MCGKSYELVFCCASSRMRERWRTHVYIKIQQVKVCRVYDHRERRQSRRTSELGANCWEAQETNSLAEAWPPSTWRIHSDIQQCRFTKI